MKNQSSINVFVFTALACEAKVIINQFKLKKENSRHPFSIYKNDKMILAVTGIGKVAMAAGVAYTLALFSESSLPILVNVGIAGHKSAAVGDLFISSKVVDAESGRVFYPQLIGVNWPESREIRTSVAPCTDYGDDCLHDMEASAFYEVAVKFTSSELIHCLKVVSDNEESSVDQIQPKIVIEWLSRHELEIGAIFVRLLELRAAIAVIELPEFNKIVNNWHFTVSGTVKLQALLKQWHVLTSTEWEVDVTEYQTGKDLLRNLEAEVGRLRIIL